uniref:Uncharacterized protein n=1 Tax=Micrurus lemniscatus lemniscatus TaxID=129467 RepID=A0A2D4HZV3_MICLE
MLFFISSLHFPLFSFLSLTFPLFSFSFVLYILINKKEDRKKKNFPWASAAFLVSCDLPCSEVHHLGSRMTVQVSRAAAVTSVTEAFLLSSQNDNRLHDSFFQSTLQRVLKLFLSITIR